MLRAERQEGPLPRAFQREEAAGTELQGRSESSKPLRWWELGGQKGEGGDEVREVGQGQVKKTLSIVVSSLD